MTSRETGAAAIWAAEHDIPCEWSTVPQADQEMYLRMFDGAVRAYTLLAAEQGCRMVPEEATEEMIRMGNMAGWKLNVRTVSATVYRFMSQAAPKFEVGE